MKPDNSCIKSTVSYHSRDLQNFKSCLDVRAVFFDISKALDKVWNQCLLCKLKQNDILDNLLEYLTDFLKDQKQRVALDGQNSSWANVEAWFSQGTILSPLLFLIYINGLPDKVYINVKLFAAIPHCFK